MKRNEQNLPEPVNRMMGGDKGVFGLRGCMGTLRSATLVHGQLRGGVVRGGREGGKEGGREGGREGFL